jgi:hypothetical protein
MREKLLKLSAPILLLALILSVFTSVWLTRRYVLEKRVYPLQKLQLESINEIAKKDKVISELQGMVDNCLAEAEYEMGLPTPTPVVIYKKTDNSEKLRKIDEQIASVKSEIERINKFLDENPYNQDAQASRRDLEYQLGILRMQRINYE